MQKLKNKASLAVKPLISISIPARNKEHFIQACVSSLIDQSYENIEILILDDNSTDKTAKEAQTLQERDPRVRIIIERASMVSSYPKQEGKLLGVQTLIRAMLFNTVL